MPQALAMSYGLDWETEVKSFWSWYKDAKDVLDDGVSAAGLVRELVETQEQAITDAASREKNPETARMVLRVTIALVGLHYASHQKLLAALRDQGLFAPPAPAAPSESASP